MLLQSTFSLILLVSLLSCSGVQDINRYNKFVEDVLLKDSAVSRRQQEREGFVLNYAEAGVAQQAIILWLHGTPGAWTEVGELIVDKQLLERVKIVSIDRPGWGQSEPVVYDGQGQRVASPDGETGFRASKISGSQYVEFSEQNRLISPLIVQLKQRYPGVPLYIGGHSWGASLAPYIAAHHNELVEGLLLFAGTLSPELAAPRWYNYVGNVWPFSAASSILRLSNAEMFALPRGLIELAVLQDALKDMAVLVIQGEDDFLVDAKNADYAEAFFNGNNSLVVVDKDYGHLWHMQRPEAIKGCVKALVERQLAMCEDAVLEERSN